MNVLRSAFDSFYDAVKMSVFRMTEDHPQKAHDIFTYFCKLIHNGNLEKLILDNDANSIHPPFEFSNAAGFNKNGEIPPTVLRYLGFDRAVVGTVTYDAWEGKPVPNILRLPKSKSMINWMEFPNKGAKTVSDIVASYGFHGVPITINFMSAPGKQGDEMLKDLEGTILATRNLPFVDRFELNVSCPNIRDNDGNKDTREKNLGMLDAMLYVVEKNVYPNQGIYLKVSPDSTMMDAEDTANISMNHRVNGFVTTNTTTEFDEKYIPASFERKGGASGNAVYDDSLSTQKLYYNKKRELSQKWKIIACGGINSIEKLSERLRYGAEGIQIYTPFVFSGPKIVRQFRKLSI